VPLQTLVDKFSHSRFEPSGMTKNPEVRFAKSIIDYIFRWMATKFLSPEAQFKAGVNMKEPTSAEATVGKPKADAPVTKVDAAPPAPTKLASASEVGKVTVTPPSEGKAYVGASMQNQEDAPPCSTCGSIMIRSGSCYKCANCGTTSGCA
jgi:ribonucleoside-diphosphate reductase alpha chain